MLVIGMHRSGTSLLANFIHQLGYSIGLDIMPPSFDNPKGFFENNQIVNLNDELLSDLSSSWDKPLFDKEWLHNSKTKSKFIDQLEKILRNEFVGSKQILIKDPRIALLIPLWLEALNHFKIKDIRIIICIRNPNDIAASLLKRNGLVPKKSLFLSAEYMMSAELWTRELNRYFFLYEDALSDPMKWDKSIKNFLHDTEEQNVHLPKLKDIVDIDLKKVSIKEGADSKEHVANKIHQVIKAPNTVSPIELDKQYKLHLSERKYLMDWAQKVHTAKIILFSDRSSIPGEIINRPAHLGHNQISVSLEADTSFFKIHFIPVDDSCSIEIKKFTVNGQPTSWTTASLLFKDNRHYYNFNYPVIKVNHQSSIQNIDIEYDIADLNQDISKIVTIALRSEELQELADEFENYKMSQKTEQTLLQNELVNLEKEFIGHQTQWSLEKQKEYIAYQRSIQELFHKYEDKTERYLVKIDNLNLSLNELQERHALQLEEARKGYEFSKAILSEKISELTTSLNEIKELHEDKLQRQKEKLKRHKRLLKKMRQEKKDLLIKVSDIDKTTDDFDEQISQHREIIHRQHNEILNFKENYAHRERELRDVTDSLSYKVGRLATWPLRMTYEASRLIWAFIPAVAGLFTLTVAAPGKFFRSLTWANFMILVRALRYESTSQILRNARKKMGLASKLSSLPRSSVQHPDKKRKTILYISPNLPDFDHSSGGRRATKMIALLVKFADVYIYTQGARQSKYKNKLTEIGAILVEGTSHEDIFRTCPELDTIIFAWYYTIHDHAGVMSHYTNAQIIVDSVDVHWIREQRSIGQVPGIDKNSVERNKRIELDAYRHADILWVVSEEDKNAVLNEIPDAEIKIVSNIHELEVDEYSAPKEANLLFFGGYNHPPNITAVHLLAKEIFPKVLERHPEARLIIAGANAPKDVIALGNLPNVVYKGFIQEEDLPRLYENALVAVAPLTAGAGIKGKICESIAYHVPVITTEIGNEGIRLRHEYDGFIGTIDETSTILNKILNNEYDLQLISQRAQKKLGQLVGPELASMRMRESIYPEISICIVTWNRLALLKRCIESILNHTEYPHYKVLIHSNGCTDGTQEYLKHLGQNDNRIIPILSETNEVFVRPNNAMMRRFESNDVVLLNNDTYVTKGWLKALRSAAYAAPEIGISGSKVLYPDGRLQEFGSELYENGTGKNIGKWDDPDKEEYQAIKRVGYVSGCSMYIKRTTIDLIGYLDDQFHPCYCEDSDYAYTAWKYELQTVVTPDSIIYHDEGGTSGTDEESGFKAYQKINFDKFLKKHGDTLNELNNLIENINEESYQRTS